jgi:hypothetical protein
MADRDDDDAYVLPDVGEVEASLGEWQSAAVYTLELPARCPHCREPIRTLRVLRLSRTQVAFTSPLPRAGRVLVCPLCERIISAELSGIL